MWYHRREKKHHPNQEYFLEQLSQYQSLPIHTEGPTVLDKEEGKLIMQQHIPDQEAYPWSSISGQSFTVASYKVHSVRQEMLEHPCEKIGLHISEQSGHSFGTHYPA